MIVVLGAGLAGLSTAYHLRKRPFRVFERETEVGGLARSVDANGFTFDFTGHLLHLQSDHVRDLVDRLLGDDQVKIDRSAWVHYAGQLVPYPFQVNTHRLPIDVKVECVHQFVQSMLAANRLPKGGFRDPERPLPLSFLNVREPTGGYARSFKDWAIATFGEGFARHFFLTYNEKNFAADLSTISADWVSWAVPKPTIEDVLRGALADPDESGKQFGYNPRFRYPRSGGIRRLPEAMARAIEMQSGSGDLAAHGHGSGSGSASGSANENLRPPAIVRGNPVVRIDARRHRATLASGETIDYRALVATNPLPELVAMIQETDDLPSEVRAAVSRLRWCAVASFNFGIESTTGLGHDRHWIYYPEKEFAFYRVGFPSNLAPSMAPPGTASLCAEVSYSTARGDSFPPKDGDAALARVRDDLRRCGALPSGARIVLEKRLDLPYAYVLFDDARRKALPVIFEALLARDIIPVGRYGAWDYLSMEQTILQGKETAEYIQADRRFAESG